ncbi:polymorphic toxin-type HINT domain-containing protein, partial [Leptospira meyeri]|uniref:polymorphic toxin-type HINT domain-containing protein n=1 Tax=Leptospira meyeri TaxID=29508 RepID=UPI0010FFEA69
SHHFNQFYPILKMKEKYNEIKAEGESVQGDPFVKSAKSLGGPMAATYVAKNLDTLKAVDSVLSSIPIVDRMNPLAMIKSFANGGILGVVTNVASVITETVSQVFTLSAAKVSVDYSYDNGFGASVDIGFGVGAARVSVINASYSEHGGFAASIGATIGKGTGFEAGAALTYSDKEGFGATASIKTAGFSAGIAYTQNSGFSASASVMLGNKSKGLQLGLNYNEKDGFSAKAGAAIGGYTGGINYSKADGVGVYAGKMLTDTTSAEIGWNRNKGFQASVGSDNARATYSEKDGLGFKFTKEVFDGEAEFAYTSRGGFEASYSKSLGNGFTGSVSYSQKDGFSANLSHKDANNISRSLSIGRDGVSGSVQQNNTDDLFIDSLEELQGMNDQTIGVNKAKIEADSFKDFADGLSKNNPELAKLKNDPAAFNAKVKELSEAGKLLDSQGKKYEIDRGGSRDSLLSKAWGEVEDIGRSFIGQTVTDMGYVDSSGKFVVRTCFVAGTKIHTKDGLKNIEDIRVGDVVLSWNEKTGEREYKVVTELFLHEINQLYEVKTTKGTTLETTWNHPFWVVDKKAWVEVKDLQVGDVLALADGTLVEISNIRSYDVEPTKVYNFEVEDNHSYFVGEDGVLVHNYYVQVVVAAGAAACLRNPACTRITVGTAVMMGTAIYQTGKEIYNQLNENNGNELKPEPGRYTDVSPIDADEMRKQGLDPLNRDDIDKFSQKQKSQVDLDKKFGKYNKGLFTHDSEIDSNGNIIKNPTAQTLQGFKPDPKNKDYIWVVDKQGTVIIGQEYSTGSKLGHPTLNGNYGRIGGELKNENGQWIINNRSGRFGGNKTDDQQMQNIADQFRKHKINVKIKE